MFTDSPIIRKARAIAFKMIHEDPHLKRHIGIKNLIFKKFRKNLDLINLNQLFNIFFVLEQSYKFAL